MARYYTITFLTDEKLQYNYTTIQALCAAHSREELGVTKAQIYNVFSKQDFYENRKVRIDRIIAYGMKDVRENKHKPFKKS